MGFGPVITLSLFIFGLMTCGTATTFFHIFPVPANPISFRPFCRAGVLVCLFVVTVADFGICP